MKPTTRVMAAGVLVAGALGAATAATASAGAATHRQERFAIVFALSGASDQPTWSRVVASGAFNAIGRLKFVDTPGGVHHDVLVFRHGKIDIRGFDGPDDFSFNPHTCTGTDHATGTYRLSGTRAYAGATGHGSWEHHAHIVTPAGPTCSPDSPKSFGVVYAAEHGSIELPD